MQELGYAKGYEYPHDYDDAMVGQVYLPKLLEKQIYYRPSERGREKMIGPRLQEIRARRAKLRRQATAKKNN